SPQVFNDWYGDQDFGWLDEHEAFRLSCNIYFYSVALGVWQAWRDSDRENVIQDLARQVGFGSETGIDLTGEAAGVMPDRELYERRKEIQLEDEDAPQLLDQARLEAASPWFGGDLMLTAIGQGDVTSTPLQVATAYVTIANGGTLYRPYVVGQIRDASGGIVHTAEPEVIGEAGFDRASVTALLEDMNRVVTTGTASAAFDGFGPSLALVGGKTGTGQSVKSKDNHAWFAGVAPIDDPQYAVAILIDEGGSGGAVAAPVARQVFQYLLGEDLDPIRAGELTD
ncbi:MAG: penicillin-binding transpeptidase domain-containing protein, partial [Acidimicrobiia bacterium]|nr:penicillin-binding transpeptidase domain-containing protein [Acidimicrobiia bacterium]